MCAPSLQWDGLCGRGNLTGVRPGPEPTARLSGVGASLVCTVCYVAGWWAAWKRWNVNSIVEMQEVSVFGIESTHSRNLIPAVTAPRP